MIFINFKTYRSGTGKKAVIIAEQCQQISRHLFIPVVQSIDVYRVTQSVSVPVWAQSADGREPFKNSGWVTPYALKQAGAAGFFINHSDCPKEKEEIEKLVTIARELKLKTLVFASSEKELMIYDKLSPDFVSLEDPSLIASSVAMVDEYEELFKKLVNKLKTPLVIGAGIRTRDHYQKALKLGAVGVVLSSQIMEAKDPEQALKELVP